MPREGVTEDRQTQPSILYALGYDGWCAFFGARTFLHTGRTRFVKKKKCHVISLHMLNVLYHIYATLWKKPGISVLHAEFLHYRVLKRGDSRGCQRYASCKSRFEYLVHECPAKWPCSSAFASWNTGVCELGRQCLGVTARIQHSVLSSLALYMSKGQLEFLVVIFNVCAVVLFQDLFLFSWCISVAVK